MQIERAQGEALFSFGFKGSLAFQTKLKTTLKVDRKIPACGLKESDSDIDYKADILCSIFMRPSVIGTMGDTGSVRRGNGRHMLKMIFTEL